MRVPSLHRETGMLLFNPYQMVGEFFDLQLIALVNTRLFFLRGSGFCEEGDFFSEDFRQFGFSLFWGEA